MHPHPPRKIPGGSNVSVRVCPICGIIGTGAWGIYAGQARCSPSQPLQLRFLYMHPHPPRKIPGGSNGSVRVCRICGIIRTGAWGISAGQARCSPSQPLQLRFQYMHPHPPRKFPGGSNVSVRVCLLCGIIRTGAWGIYAGQARCSPSQTLQLRFQYMHPHPPRKFPGGSNVSVRVCLICGIIGTGAWGIYAGQARCSPSQTLQLRF